MQAMTNAGRPTFKARRTNPPLFAKPGPSLSPQQLHCNLSMSLAGGGSVFFFLVNLHELRWKSLNIIGKWHTTNSSNVDHRFRILLDIQDIPQKCCNFSSGQVVVSFCLV